MSKRQSLLFAVAILGLAFVFSYLGSAFSQTTAPATRGPYAMAGSYDRMMIWRIDQATGKVSYCRIDSMSTDPKYMAERPPYCSAWSQQ